MRTLRGRIGLALLSFALITLVSVGGALWVVLRDLHRDTGTAALAELLVPYVTQARARLLPPLLDGPLGEREGAGTRLLDARRFLVAAQAEISEAGVTLMLARGDGSLVVITPEGTLVAASQDWDVQVPQGRGEVSRGSLTMEGMGDVLYAATPIFAGRFDRDIDALVMVRPDDSAGLATADMLRALGFAALLLVLVGMPLAAWLGRSVARPLDRLAGATELVARGQVPAPLPEDGPTEVARASAAFNAMAAEVAMSRDMQRQLLADVRHDLRTPLTVISGFAEALRDGTATGNAATRAADAIADEAARLGRMLSDLGELAELDPGSPPLRPEALDAREMVMHAVRRFEPQAGTRGQRIRAADGSRPGPVLADRSALERILANLVANAIAHAPSPGGLIQIEALPVRSGDPPVGGRGGWSGKPGVLVAVRDDGPGIPAGSITRVFDRFFRADPARSGPGSGLGLAIVASLAHAQGGRAFAENPPGGGARVGVVLPAASSGPAA